MTDHLARDNARAQPWKNGGGVTHELWRTGDGASGFGVRLSIAEIATDGPFSLFPGVDRTISLLRGKGFTLHRDDGLHVAITTPAEPFCFCGEDRWTSTLRDGPVHDFNVMVDRASWHSVVWPAGPGVVDATHLLALGAGVVGGVAVGPEDLIFCDGPVDARVAVLAVRVRRRAQMIP